MAELRMTWKWKSSALTQLFELFTSKSIFIRELICMLSLFLQSLDLGNESNYLAVL